MWEPERQLRSYIGKVVTFNSLLDNIESMFADGLPVKDPLEGHIGIVVDYALKYCDPGDPENGPRLELHEMALIVYVPAYGRTFHTTPEDWVTDPLAIAA